MPIDVVPTDFRSQEQTGFESKFQKITGNKYKVAQYTYPSGIGSNPDMQHYIAFFINVRGKSKFNKGKGEQGFQELLDNVKVGVGQNRLDPNKTSQAITAAGAVTGASVGGAGAILSGLKDGKFNLSSVSKGIASAVGGAVVGAAAAKGLQALGVLEADTLKRLSDVIVLHIQDKPTTSYSVNYQDKEVGALGGLLAGGTSAADLAQAGIGQIGKEGTTATIKAIIDQVGSVFNSESGRLFELGTKQKTNSFREQFFESVDFRTFSFKHTFMPRSQAEVDNVKNIVKLFKFHMHPELSKTGLFYLYPSEFEIKYYYREKENEYFDKISSCVLEDMSVEYGGDTFSTFEDGKPVEVNLTLKFKELEILTKERVKEGY